MIHTQRRICLLIAAALAMLGSSVRADSIFMGTLERKNVTIREIKDGMVVFEIDGRLADPIEVPKVTRIEVRGETAFNAGEEAYIAEDWVKAAENYKKALTTSNKEWLKAWASQRLVEAANKSNRFDAAVTAYIQLVMTDPGQAARAKPQLPEEKGSQLNTAAAELTAAVGSAKTDAQKQTLLTFLLEIQRARGDTKAINEVAEQIVRISGNSDDPIVQRGLAELKLGIAKTALNEKRYDKALQEIEGGRQLFNDPAQQAQALFYIAEAKYGQLGNKDDPAALQDIALAYMRVVAHFRDLPGAPHIGDSLLRVADIHVRLGETKQAQETYQSVANQFKGQPAGDAAAKKLQELNSKG